MIWRVLLVVATALVLSWLVLVVVLWRAAPEGGADGTNLKNALRLLPDVVRLFRRLASDRAVSRGVRVRIWLLLAYLACPIDLVPDFIPVIGYADDVVVVAIVLRSVVRRAGPDVVTERWSGTPEGLAALRRIAGLAEPPPRTGG